MEVVQMGHREDVGKILERKMGPDKYFRHRDLTQVKQGRKTLPGKAPGTYLLL